MTKHFWWPALILVLATACVSVDERRRQTLERSERAMETGDVSKALQILDSFLSYDPRDLEIISRMAEIHLEVGSPRVALTILESVPGDTDWDSRSRELLARALVGSEHMTRAVRLLSRMESQDQADPETVAELIEHLAKSGVPKSLKLPASWLPALAEEQLDQRRFAAAAETLRGIEPPKDRDRLFDRLIREALDAGEIELLSRLEEVEQPPATPWKLLARHGVLRAKGLGDEAAAVERTFLERFPEHPRRYHVLLSLARRENRSGRAEQGLDYAREAAALRPSRVEPLVEQALAVDALGDSDRARRILEMALTSAPNHSGALGLLARLDDRLKEAQSESNGSARLRLSIDTESGS